MSLKSYIARSLILLTLAISACVSACSDDTTGAEPDEMGNTSCPPNTRYNPILDRCVATAPTFNDMGKLVDQGDPSDLDDPAQEMTPDLGPNCPMTITVYADNDNDGFGSGQPATRCATPNTPLRPGEADKGGDCDDRNFDVNPDQEEVCDGLDNNCAGGVDEGLSCRFYAHTSSELYLINPFTFEATRVASVDGFFDMDTDATGTLYGMTTSTLYRFDANAMRWVTVGNHGIPATKNANGFAIERGTRAFVTAGNDLYELDITTATSRRIGAMGGNYNSSGDCVVNKGDQLFMTSSGAGPDLLVRIDGTNAAATTAGSTGYDQIYGLTFGWGKLFGMTGRGQLLSINPLNGQATLLHTFQGKSWYGAASSPER